MRKICLIIFTLISLNSSAQKGNNNLFSEYEDTLKVMAHTIMNAETEAEKRLANQAFITNLTEVLQYEKSFNFPFDSNSTSETSTPSYTTPGGNRTPANADTVGNTSKELTTSLLTVYGIIVPGQYANAASRMPPSHVEP